eukprot:3994746-Pyramimonas_sp.AAC.2
MPVWLAACGTSVAPRPRPALRALPLCRQNKNKFLSQTLNRRYHHPEAEAEASREREWRTPRQSMILEGLLLLLFATLICFQHTGSVVGLLDLRRLLRHLHVELPLALLLHRALQRLALHLTVKLLLLHFHTLRHALRDLLRGDSPTEGVNAPAEGVNSPTEGVNSPTEGVNAPTEGVKSPTEGINSPAEGDQRPQKSN